MLGSTGPSGSPSFSLALGEEDVRRRCGPAAFKRGEALQRAGHVHRTTVAEDTLSADVLGTWRRYDRVTAKAVKISGSSRGPLLEVSCTCRGGSGCRHVAALLLQWVREPASFAVPRPPAAPVPAVQRDEEDEVIEPGQEETPLQELFRLLGTHTAVRLREIARQRRVRPVARNKGELIEQLTSLLAEPENIDSTLLALELEDDQRLTLDAVDLLGAAGRATPEAIGVAYRALGGRRDPRGPVSEALEALVNLGLAVSQERPFFPSGTYIVPRVVAGRLPAREDLLPVLDENRPAAEAASRGPRLGMTEILQVIVHELEGGAISVNLPAASPLENRTIPEGWRSYPDDRSPNTRATLPYGQRDVLLAPMPPLLPAADLGRLAERTGQPAGMIDFALRLSLSLGLVERAKTTVGSRLMAREDGLRSFLALPSGERLAHMVTAWLGMADSLELSALVGEDGPLRLYYRTSYYSWTRPQPHGAAVRRLIARLIGRSQRGKGDCWYDFSSLLDLLWHLAPSLLSGGEQEITWWLTDSREPNRSLNLSSRDDWRRIWSPLVASILTGPMSWLGLVDVAPDRAGGRPQAFQLGPASAVLGGKEEAGELEVAEGRPPLLVQLGPDGAPIIVVPAGSLDEQLHSLLVAVCDLVDASPRGLHYRVAIERLQLAFDDGLTGPQLVGFLEERAGGAIPQDVRNVLEGWWTGYGNVRLYDDLTLLDLGDDILLRELRATTSLEDAMVDTFTPRLVAVDGARVEALIAELRSLGHTPRVVEEP